MDGWMDDWVEKGREGQRLLKHGKQDWWERTPVAYKSLYFCQEASGGKNLNKVWGTQRKRTRRILNKNFTTSSTRLSVCQSLKFRLPNQTQFTLDVPRGLFCQRDVPDKYCMMDHYYCICEINLLYMCCIMSIFSRSVKWFILYSVILFLFVWWRIEGGDVLFCPDTDVWSTGYSTIQTAFVIVWFHLSDQRGQENKIIIINITSS